MAMDLILGWDWISSHDLQPPPVTSVSSPGPRGCSWTSESSRRLPSGLPAVGDRPRKVSTGPPADPAGAPGGRGYATAANAADYAAAAGAIPPLAGVVAAYPRGPRGARRRRGRDGASSPPGPRPAPPGSSGVSNREIQIFVCTARMRRCTQMMYLPVTTLLRSLVLPATLDSAQSLFPQLELI